MEATIRVEQAEILSLGALAWLAAEEELWPVFLGSSGADAGDLRARLASGQVDTPLLVAVLEFLTMDDAWVLRAAESLSVPPETLLQALHALPGGAPVHWT